MFVSFVANLFHEFVGDLGSLVWPGGMRGAITIKATCDLFSTAGSGGEGERASGQRR